MCLLIVLVTIVVTVAAAPQRQPEEVPTPYDYQYKVENPPTNTFFGQSEAGDPAGRVTGSYYVYLPDGRLLTVDYSADDQQGFVPRVSYQLNAVRPAVVVAQG